MNVTTCPECDAPLEIDQEWLIIDWPKIGQPVGRVFKATTHIGVA